jgi:hypothetical protein
MQKSRWLLALTALLLSSSVWAVPITFTYTGTGSGSLGGSAFSDAAFTITATGDTDDRQSFLGGFFIDHGSAVIDIQGLGSISFLTATRTFVNNAVAVVGFSRAGTSGSDLYNSFDVADYATWDMLTAIGPIASSFGLLQWDLSAVNTGGGVLSFNSAVTRGSFQARLAVPAPGVLGLFSLALLALAITRRPRRASLQVL